MNHLGEKIRNLRKKKGLSQEELAEFSKINLRTLQRIENAESEPRSTTLNLICNALEVNAEDILDYGKQTDNSILVSLHLSVLTGLVIPMGNIIIPFILWVTKKEKIIGLKKMGANLLNFQIVWTFLSFLTLIFGAFIKIMHIKFGLISGNIVMTFAIPLFYLVNIVLPLIFAIKTRNGNVKDYYPNIIRLIK